MNFFRSKEYQDYFDYIDQANGIFYERWYDRYTQEKGMSFSINRVTNRGDPVIQSLGAVLFLEKSDIQFWENIGYRVAGYFLHCPTDKTLYSKCSCRPSQNFDNDGYSCLKYF